jgi:hypothetical protein
MQTSDLSWLLSAVLTLTIAPAQVSPAHASHTEGNANGFAPFGGSTTPDRCLQVHDDLPGARTISALSFRPEYLTSGQTNRITFALALSNAPAGISGSNLAPTFEQNHGNNQRRHTGLDVTFPPAPHRDGDPLPRPFVYRIPLPSPFASTGMTSLVWDLEVQTRPSPQGSLALDAVTGLANPWRVAFAFRQGCRVRQTASPTQHWVNMSPDWNNLTMNVRLDAGQLEPQGSVLFAVGFSASSWLGLPLPLPLPGTDSSPSGQCYVNSSWDVIGFAAAADANGHAFNSFAVRLPAAVGLNLYTQAIGLAANANAFGIVPSNSVHAYLAPPVLTPPPVGRVYRAGTTGTPVVQANTGYVVQIEG